MKAGEAPVLLDASAVVVRFGGFCALDGVDLQVHAGERLGLIGPNGSGKSTLTHCIGGALVPTSGTISWQGRALGSLAPHSRALGGIARSFQIPRPFRSMTARENVMLPLLFRDSATRPAQAAIEADAILAAMGLSARADTSAATFSQVELRKLELGRAIATGPRLLIADEAMAGLSGSEMEEILDLLMGMKERGIAVLMIEHIMQAVTRFSERIVVLLAGRKIADGSPTAVLGMPHVIQAYLGE